MIGSRFFYMKGNDMTGLSTYTNETQKSGDGELLKLASLRMRRLPPYLFERINKAKVALRRQNIDIIDLGMGNPNDPTPGIVVEKLQEAAGHKRNQRYSASRGIENLRREYARFYGRRLGVGLDPESEIIACLGSKEGFSHLCLAVLGPGDLALTTAPVFPIHLFGPVIAGAEVISVPFEEKDEDLLRKIEALTKRLMPKPKIIVLNFPHNPTGRTVERDFFREAVRLAKRHEFYIIHDFAYGHTCFDGYRAPSFLSVDGAKDVGVELGTLSKAYNMAGWRIGFAAGNRRMVSLLGDIKGYFDYGIFQAVQIAAIMALRECDDQIEAQALIYQGRRDVLVTGLRELGFEVEKPRAGMFVWARIPEPYSGLGSMGWSLACLDKAHIVVSPGIGFGEEGEGWVRIALTENEERLRQGLRQLKAAFPLTGESGTGPANEN
jgi:alanine-synthesizing transaminase